MIYEESPVTGQYVCYNHLQKLDTKKNNFKLLKVLKWDQREFQMLKNLL